MVKAALITSLLIVAAHGLAHAETVTAGVGGSEDYATLKAAVDDYASWSDGSSDTIEVTDAGINPIDAEIAVNFAPSGGLTIGNASGATPIMRVDTSFAGFAIEISGASMLTVNGLTFIGLSGADQGDNMGVFGIEDPGENNTLSLYVNECFVSANNGSDGPLTDPALKMGNEIGKL
jgi:hypothetical protein